MRRLTTAFALVLAAGSLESCATPMAPDVATRLVKQEFVALPDFGRVTGMDWYGPEGDRHLVLSGRSGARVLSATGEAV